MSVPARLAVQQRVLPEYRVPFFDHLAAAFQAVSLFSGQPQGGEALGKLGHLQQAQQVMAGNIYIGQMPNALLYQRGLTAWLAAWQPHVLVMEANPRNLTIPLARRWMQARGRPVIGWGLGVPAVSGLRGQVWRSFLKPFDAIIAYSQRGAQSYRSAGFPTERVFVAPNAATPPPASPPPARPAEFAAGHPTVLFVGRLQARKRIDLLFQACAGLPPDLQPRVWIVGDGPARPELETLASQIYPAGQFFGELRGAELDPLLAAADLFALPGTGGLAVQQAMSAGLPVIVAEGDGTQDDLVRPANGWQVTPGSLSDLTRTLADALQSPARLRQMGAESYRIVADEINLDTMVAGFVRAVQSVFPSCCNY